MSLSTEWTIPATTSLGRIVLRVADLELSLRFYQGVLGFSPERLDDGRVGLGLGGEAPLVQLVERPGIGPAPARRSGLYHFALLVPRRVDLARALATLIEHRYPLGGASDHLVSEALYLSDPDGNGIEIYADRPRERWPRQNGLIEMATTPLDLQMLLEELAKERTPEGLPAGTTLGHVHLHVGDLAAAEDFYVGLLGFDLIARYGPSALFVSAGGYHHHIGLNTWAGVDAPQAGPDSAGMRYFTIRLPDRDAFERVAARLREAGRPVTPRGAALLTEDPAGNGILLEG